MCDQFNKLGIISQAEFENQRNENVGGEEEDRHEVANNNDDDLQFELDETADKRGKEEAVNTDRDTNTEQQRSSSASTKPTTPKKITESTTSIERDSLYWLESNARFYPVPIRPNNTVKQNYPVSCNGEKPGTLFLFVHYM